jgi:hypothetical protein
MHSIFSLKESESFIWSFFRYLVYFGGYCETKGINSQNRVILSVFNNKREKTFIVEVISFI